MSSVESIALSWRTDSRSRVTSCNLTKTTNNTIKSSSYIKRKVNVVSAKNSGMKFPSWREPKPIRSYHPSSPAERETPDKQFPVIRRRVEANGERDLKSILDRLSAPTLSQRMKTIKLNPRTSMLNMNYYSWSNMAAYKEHQKTLYCGNGSMKKSYRKSAKR